MLLCTAVGLCLGLASAAGSDLPGKGAKGRVATQAEAGTCGKYGTSVEFVGSPAEAARQAKKDEKLVFVLHVSGHFEDPRFT
jgi:hypothetical protein